MNNKWIKIMGTAAIASSMVATVHAVPTLWVDGVAKASDASGNVNFSGTVDGWKINVDFGDASPPDPSLGGSATSPVLDVTFNLVHMSGSTGLTLLFTDDGVGPILGVADHAIGGTSKGVTVTSSVTLGAAPGVVVPGLTLGPFSTTSYGGEKTGLLIAGPGSTLGLQDVFSGAVGASISGDENLTVTPDGGTTLALLGMAFSGCAVLRRKVARA